MAAWRYEISLRVLKKYFEEKFRISKRPCNILYLTLANSCGHTTDFYLGKTL